MVEDTAKQALDAEKLLTGLSFVIKQKRKEKQLTQEDLSCDVGLARGYLSDVECGARNFSMKNLVKIANGLDVRPSELISMAEEYMRRRPAEVVRNVPPELNMSELSGAVEHSR